MSGAFPFAKNMTSDHNVGNEKKNCVPNIRNLIGQNN